MTNSCAALPLAGLEADHPEIIKLLQDMGIHGLPPAATLGDSLAALSGELLEDIGCSRQELLLRCDSLIGRYSANNSLVAISSLTVIGGRTKSGAPENFVLELRPGEVTAIVGPTGSGKSRFLADIEWLAQGDTPTGRRILINGSIPPPDLRYSVEQKLVAQLSQNMNFVMDLSAAEFIMLHAESRQAADVTKITATIIDMANALAGERFTPDTPVTALSGGQSRALMIADVACLSSSPIVLIDEIENAGIDRKRALSLLTGNSKIVLMATHDPILAMLGSRRLVFSNGAISNIIVTSDQERHALSRFEQMDSELNRVRNSLRNGETISC